MVERHLAMAYPTKNHLLNNERNSTHDIIGSLPELLPVRRRLASLVLIFRPELCRERKPAELAAHERVLHEEHLEDVARRAGQEGKLQREET